MLKRTKGLAAVLLIAGIGLLSLAQEAPKPAAPGPLVLIDSAGKEQKLTTWSFTTGVRRLSWLAPEEKPKETEKDKLKDKEKPAQRPAAVGPEALVVCDELKIHFLPAVMTFVPLNQLRSIQFDGDKSTMIVRVAVSAKEEDDVVLTCTAAYKGLNKLVIKAEVDKGDAGVAEMTYQGGTLKNNLKEVRFPAKKIEPHKAGRPAVVVTKDKAVIKTHKVSDLQPIYLEASGREKLLPTLMFKKTLKLDVAKIKKIVASTEDSDDVVWQVVQKDGDDSSLTVIESPTLNGGKVKLLGLLGRMPIGYRLFPLRNISAIHFDTTEEPKEPEKEKEKDKKSDD